ncbi:hypothetical protein [Petrachloros mirabilis]
MNPTKEQIEAWLLESSCIRQIGFCVYCDSPPMPVIGFVAHRPQVETAIELAYAAGRKAGMEEERLACIDAIESKDRLYQDGGEFLTTRDALDAIRARSTMGADK